MVNNGPARLFRNDGGNANHWVRLALKGNGKTSNRDAIGAKVELKMGDQTCRRQLFPAKGYLSSVELPLTFGLGKADKVDELTITWPSGKVTTLRNLKANQMYRVNEETGVVKWAWFKNARFRVTHGISARTLIGPALERVYATPG